MSQRPQPQSGEVYRHHRGREYVVVCVARECDLYCDFVIHKGADGRFYARSVQNFLGVKDGIERFKRVGA